MSEDLPAKPANFETIVAINRGEIPLTMALPEIPALSPAQVRERLGEGCLVVDIRDPALFGMAHIPGSYNIQVSSSRFEQRVGWILPPDIPLILVAERPEDARHALRLLAFLGLDQRVDGFLGGGIPAWIDEGFRYDTVRQIGVHELHGLVGRGEITVIDVREAEEWGAGHVEGALNVSYREIDRRVSELNSLSPDPVACICELGYRSSTAASVLKRNGFALLCNVTGGFDAWRSGGLPVVTADRPRIQAVHRLRHSPSTGSL